MIQDKLDLITKLVKKLMDEDDQELRSDYGVTVLDELESLESLARHLDDFDPYESVDDWSDELIPILEEMD